MTGFTASVFLYRSRVSSKEAFEGLEPGDGKPSRPVLRGPGDRKVVWLLGSYRFVRRIGNGTRTHPGFCHQPSRLTGSDPFL